MIRKKLMKKIQIIASQRLINPATGKVHSIEGLRARNAYYESLPFEVDDNYDPNTVVLKFEEKYPEYTGWLYKIIEL